MKTESCAEQGAIQQKTICDHPRLLRWVHRIFAGGFGLRGWRFEQRLPSTRKYVLIVAPHTSNWDFFLLVAMGAALRRKVHFMAKHSLFIGPLGPLLKWLGGIPVDRGQRHNFVEQMAAEFSQRDDMALIITPEGTRGRVEHWKCGFYHIAHGAGVPVVALGLDYGARQIRIVSETRTTGDLEADLRVITASYRGVVGRHPELDGFARGD